MTGTGTILDCLNVVFGLVQENERSPVLVEESARQLNAAPTLAAQFTIIRRQYFNQARIWHPDKSSDPNATEVFRRIQSAFESLRHLYETDKSISSFLSDDVLPIIVDGDFASNNDGTESSKSRMRRPQPWEVFAAAEGSDEPYYRVELAKSGRSRCSASGRAQRCKKETIMKNGQDTLVNATIGLGEIRIGVYDVNSGTYGWWKHLECWRVPMAIWKDLSEETNLTHDRCKEALLNMNELLLSGIRDLSDKDLNEFINHVVDCDNWAKKTEKKVNDTSVKSTVLTRPAVNVPSTMVGSSFSSNIYAKDNIDDKSTSIVGKGEPNNQQSSMGPDAIVKLKAKFVIPIPGQGKALSGALQGKTFVLTGIFPELGGGGGLDMGKGEAKRWITSFGGFVRSAVSGKTNYLLVGKDPGMSKVTKANDMGVTRLNVSDLKMLCEGGSDENIEPLQITSFSSGYMGTNGLALEASTAWLEAIAAPNNPIKKLKAIENSADSSCSNHDKKKASNKNNPASSSATTKQNEAAAKREAAKSVSEMAKKARQEVQSRKRLLKETAIEDLDWKLHLKHGDLDTEKVPFLRELLKVLGLETKGKKNELLNRLQEHALKVEEDIIEEEDVVVIEETAPKKRKTTNKIKQDTEDEDVCEIVLTITP